jgi:hypothetical protein
MLWGLPVGALVGYLAAGITNPIIRWFVYIVCSLFIWLAFTVGFSILYEIEYGARRSFGPPPGTMAASGYFFALVSAAWYRKKRGSNDQSSTGYTPSKTTHAPERSAKQMSDKIANESSARHQTIEEASSDAVRISHEPRLIRENKSPDKQANREQESLLDEFELAKTAIEYREETADDWGEIQKLPQEYQRVFLDALNADPKQDTSVLSKKLLAKCDQELRPFEDDELNQAFSEIMMLSKEAAEEFKRVQKHLGDSVPVADLVEKISKKYGLTIGTRVPDETEVARWRKALFQRVDLILRS